jgi:hypothetical protein
MSTETLANEQASGSKIDSLILAIFGLGILYLLFGVLSYFWIAYQVPITASDIDSSSWLAPRMGVQFHTSVIGGMIALLAFGKFFLGRFVASFVLAIAAACAIIGGSESGALRVGVLNGDAKIGCFTYQALECRRMLGLSEEGARSIYLADKRTAGAGNPWGYADWYLPIRLGLSAQSGATYPSTFPGVAIFVSPFMLGKVDELNESLSAQRAELAAQKVAPKSE